MCIDEYLDEDFMIWIDTCSILHEQFQAAIDCISAKLLLKKSTIYITDSVNIELKKHAVSGNDDLKIKAQKALSVVNWYLSNGVITIYNQNSKNHFADNDLLTIFTELRIKHNLLLITQDKNLSSDIWALKKSKSVQSREVRVAKITLAGDLEIFKINEDNEFDKIFQDGFNIFNSMFGNTDKSNLFDDEDCISDFQENICGIVNRDIEGNIHGNVTGITNGDIEGDIHGNVLGIIKGNVIGDIHGNVMGTIEGNVMGSIRGNVMGIIKGDVEGDIRGRVSGIIEGDVKGYHR